MKGKKGMGNRGGKNKNLGTPGRLGATATDTRVLEALQNDPYQIRGHGEGACA